MNTTDPTDVYSSEFLLPRPVDWFAFCSEPGCGRRLNIDTGEYPVAHVRECGWWVATLGPDRHAFYCPTHSTRIPDDHRRCGTPTCVRSLVIAPDDDSHGTLVLTGWYLEPDPTRVRCPDHNPATAEREAIRAERPSRVAMTPADISPEIIDRLDAMASEATELPIEFERSYPQRFGLYALRRHTGGYPDMNSLPEPVTRATLAEAGIHTLAMFGHRAEFESAASYVKTIETALGWVLQTYGETLAADIAMATGANLPAGLVAELVELPNTEG